MSNEDGSEDRLDKTDFAELIQHLSIQEVIEIEYRIGTNWRKLFVRKNVAANTFFCNLCAVETSSFKNLLAHIDGRKHKLQMERVQQFYHPDYTHPKNDKKVLKEKPKLATKPANSNKSIIPSSSALSNKAQIIENPSCGLSVAKNIAVSPGDSGKDNKNNKTTIEKKTSVNDIKVVQGGETTTKDSINIETVDKDETTLNEEKEQNKNVKNASTTNKVVEQNKNTKSNGSQQKMSAKDESLNTLGKEWNQGETVTRSKKPVEESAVNNKKNVDKKSGSKETNRLSSSTLVKNPFAQGNKQVVDNDSEDGSNPNEVSDKSASIENKESNSRIRQKNTVTNAKDGKRQLPDDATADKTSGGEGTVLKKAKVVLNPASALTDKAASSTNTEKDKREFQDNADKPQYQTDKIIIPTKHKSRKDKESPRDITTSSSSLSSSQNKDLPQFSVKTYSSKPSDNDVYGILGVEYVIKILKNRTDTSPRYECGLCELVLDGFAMQRHLEGYNHRLKFCEKHFPTAIRHYRQYMHNIPEHDLFKVMTPVLAKLATAIEQHHGRNLPYECYERDFSLNRHEILAKAFSCRHASEQYGPTFTHVVGAKEIDFYINERHRYMPPSMSRTAIFDSKAGNNNRSESRHGKDLVARDRHRHADRSGEMTLQHGEPPYKSYMSSTGYNDLYPPSNAYAQPVVSSPVVNPVDDETYKIMVDDFLKDTLKGISGGRSRDHRKRSASPSRTPSSTKRKSLSPLRQNDIWQAYRHMVDQELTNLDERFKQYRKDPETHPSYNEEWQKFWKRRKDELISAGLDHRKYNYQPEWVRFIKVRIEELYSQEVENLKIKSRERLCLSMSNNNLSDTKYHVQAPKIDSPDVVLITNTDSNNVLIGVADNTIITHAPSNSFATPGQQSNAGNPQVVSVLRLMTALEDDLGSLGPKIIDILSKALQAEKTNPAQINAIILNEENCTIIETAKEKLKGLIMAGLFEGSKNRVLKKVVNDTEALLSHAQQFRQAAVPSETRASGSNLSSTTSSSSTANVSAMTSALNAFKNQTPNQPNSSLSIGALLTQFDKKELASKLAASLVAQGKTDFDPKQLQQLIAVYTLIEKKKRIATASTNKGHAMPSALSNKKTLSDMLSDLLKPTSTSKQNSTSTTTEAAYRMTTQSASEVVSANPNSYANNFNNAFSGGVYTSNSTFPSASQNSSGNYLSNATQSIDNAMGVSRGGGEAGLPAGGGRVGFGVNHSNNSFNPSYQQPPNPNNMYNNNNPYQNNMGQNWNWNPPTMGTNQNYNMGGSSGTNQWRNF